MALNDKGHLSDGELKNGVEAIDKEITAIRERSPGVKKAFLKRKEEVQRVRENIRRQRDLD